MTAFYGHVKGHIQWINRVGNAWELKPCRPPKIVTCPRTDQLSDREIKHLTAFMLTAPGLEKEQVFAKARGLSRKNMTEDQPATNVFGPDAAYTGFFKRQGRSYLQLGFQASPTPTRYEIVERTNQCWRVSTKNGLFWQAADFKELWTFTAQNGSYKMELFEFHGFGQRCRYDEIFQVYDEEESFPIGGDAAHLNIYEEDDVFANNLSTQAAPVNRKRVREATIPSVSCL